MKRRRNTRNRRRLQLLTMFVCFLLCTGFAVQNSARKIDAESDLNRITYKYYKSYYVETGDSLWSIAKENISEEYANIGEYIAEVKGIFDKNNIKYQVSELGEVDIGGGGTIAYILANKGIDVIDCGVPVLCMHSPYEVTSKYDVYTAYKAYQAFWNA